MIRKRFTPGNIHVPPGKIGEKRIGVANSAKRKERSGIDLAQVSLGRVRTESPESEQACLRVKYRAFVCVRGFSRWALEFSSNHQDIGSFAGGNGLTQ